MSKRPRCCTPKHVDAERLKEQAAGFAASFSEAGDHASHTAAELAEHAREAAVHAKESAVHAKDWAAPRVEAAIDWASPRVEAAIDWASPRVERAIKQGVTAAAPRVERAAAVSYTHLTLPTNR